MPLIDTNHIHGPFDIIGDVHGCYDELLDLLVKLGYVVNRIEASPTNFGFLVTTPPGRIAVFLGDLVDRGPNSPDVLRLVMSMTAAGTAYCVPGNHDMKLYRYLEGRDVKMSPGLQKTIDQLADESDRFKTAIKAFINQLPSHYILDDGNLVVAHAGIKEDMQGVDRESVVAFCLFGDTTGKVDEYGLPIRLNWALNYKGRAMVVYGHTPVPELQWVNNTIDIDTGCVFGGWLTALRYPERELVSVKSKNVYEISARPIDWEQSSLIETTKRL